jgi:hypothetical protein
VGAAVSAAVGAAVSVAIGAAVSAAVGAAVSAVVAQLWELLLFHLREQRWVRQLLGEFSSRHAPLLNQL